MPDRADADKVVEHFSSEGRTGVGYVTDPFDVYFVESDFLIFTPPLAILCPSTMPNFGRMRLSREGAKSDNRDDQVDLRRGRHKLKDYKQYQ